MVVETSEDEARGRTEGGRTEGGGIGEKTKIYLEQKKIILTEHIKRVKKKRRVIKIIYIVTVVSSIACSAIAGTIATLSGLPVMIIPIFSITSAVLTGISFRFNFKSKKEELVKLLENLSYINNTLDYVISTNGHMTEENHKDIIKSLSSVF